ILHAGISNIFSVSCYFTGSVIGIEMLLLNILYNFVALVEYCHIGGFVPCCLAIGLKYRFHKSFMAAIANV
ncbi:hypothetical protein ACJX0J_019118, partial [Zea mays]